MKTVAIAGRPNVGKSTLFNRLVGRRLALVHDRPGVTRDRRDADARLGRLTFRLIDTAGFEDAKGSGLETRIQDQAAKALAEADLCLLVIDARAGVTPLDEIFADHVRTLGKPVVVIANKCEGRAADPGVMEAHQLGLGDPVAMSAEHGLGLSDLLERVTPHLATDEIAEDDEAVVAEAPDGEAAGTEARPLRLAVVGRPNVGKSTLINALIGSDRLITGPEAGITRDAIEVRWHDRGRAVSLFDTAGLRRKAQRTDDLDQISAGDSLRAIRFAEVAVLVLDATQALEKQDLQLADLIAREGRAIVIALNKWDLIEHKQKELREVRERIERLLPQIKGVGFVLLSALYETGLDRLMPAVWQAYDTWNARVPTSALNDWLARAVEAHPPPAVRGRRVRIRYITQAKSRPPTFIAFSSRGDALPESYLRYLQNGLRDTFGLPGVPLRLHLRKPKNPYEPRGR